MQIERIEIVAIEGSAQDAADLIEIAGHFKLLDRAAHRKIVDHDLPLVNGALRHATEFAKLGVVQMLDSQPDARPHHRQHQSHGAARRPQQKEAEHGKYRGDGIKNDHYLAMRKAHLQQLVVNVFAVGGEDRAATDQPSQDGN